MRTSVPAAAVLAALSIGFRPAPGADPEAWIPFVIPWDDASPGPADVSFLLEPPAGGRGFVEARDGHFYAGGRRIRFWGVNLCFGACFPAPDDAPRVAARLAKAGVNAVRFHHMDSAPFPRGIFQDRGLEELSPEALDRLDRLIAELKRRGIYANLNLHVSRWWSRAHGWPAADALESYDKMLGIFHPDLIDAQKRYARDLLTHRNPHTGLRYVEEPAIAMVEITNEDSLFMWSSPRFLPEMPEPYAGILDARWNGWLRERYGSDAKLREAWAEGAAPLGADVLGASPWRFEEHEGSRMRATEREGDGGRILRIEIERTTGTSWHLQAKRTGIRIEKGSPYALRFRARADRPKTVAVGVGQEREPWANLGLATSARLEPAWRSLRFFFAGEADEGNARLSFSVGADATALEIADVELRPGGVEGIAAGESIARGVALYPREFAITRGREGDRLRFLHDLERAYFVGMRDFLKRDLGVRALVTGTIAFGSLGTAVQAEMDFVDQHAYWQHPRFPNRPWDPRDWIVRNIPMSADPRGGTLPALASTRVFGKPYTVTEYNHPAPLDSQAETVPMLASFAALQDWDGVFLFTYNHSDDWRRDRIHGFFDIDANPSKWGFMAVGALVFAAGGIAPFARGDLRTLGRDATIDAARLSPTHLLAWLEKTGADARGFLERRWAIAFGDRAGLSPLPPSGDPHRAGRIRWEKGRYLAFGRAAGVACGSLAGEPFTLGDVAIRVARPASASIAIAARDGNAIEESRDILMVACGRCENVGMGWNADRSSVGDRWGSPPVRIEPVDATVEIPSRASGLRVRALDPRGQPAAEIPVERIPNGFRFSIGAGRPSLWYAIEASAGGGG